MDVGSLLSAPMKVYGTHLARSKVGASGGPVNGWTSHDLARRHTSERVDVGVRETCTAWSGRGENSKTVGARRGSRARARVCVCERGSIGARARVCVCVCGGGRGVGYVRLMWPRCTLS
jgi:hypothetical protein